MPVYIGAGYLSRVGAILKPHRRSKPIILVTDRVVARLHLQAVKDSLRQAGWAVSTMVLPPGESIKSLRVVTTLHREWFARGFDRSAPVVALGGGTIADGVGFAAATFLRGLLLWQVPTTVVAQVDAALGGKVGINHPLGKNLIGCFYQPSGVIIDPLALTSLPPRERCAGLAEVVKYGVITDPGLFRRCERDMIHWINSERPMAADVIRRCVKIKLRTVAEDETDAGARRILNFGHTLGHAFERWGGYRRLRHGEAVILGMMGAAWMARERGWFGATDFQRLDHVCRRLFVPAARFPGFRSSEILRHLQVDKKRQDGRNIWVLPRRIGSVTLADDISDRDTKGAVAFVHAWLHDKPEA